MSKSSKHTIELKSQTADLILFYNWRDPLLNWLRNQEMNGKYKTNVKQRDTWCQEVIFTDARDAVLFKTTWWDYQKQKPEDLLLG